MVGREDFDSALEGCVGHVIRSSPHVHGADAGQMLAESCVTLSGTHNSFLIFYHLTICPSKQQRRNQQLK